MCFMHINSTFEAAANVESVEGDYIFLLKGSAFVRKNVYRNVVINSKLMSAKLRFMSSCARLIWVASIIA
jgi:hypothetical protein